MLLGVVYCVMVPLCMKGVGEGGRLEIMAEHLLAVHVHDNSELEVDKEPEARKGSEIVVQREGAAIIASHRVGRDVRESASLILVPCVIVEVWHHPTGLEGIAHPPHRRRGDIPTAYW